MQIVVGQRWLSENDPELGLGVVLEAGFGRMTLYFPAKDEQRVYSLETAALRRVRLQVGDTLTHEDSQQYTVSGVLEEDGLLVYQCGEIQVLEEELSATMDFSKAEDRLLAGRADSGYHYNLRKNALQLDAMIRRSPVRGFVGGKVDLIPHQLSIVKTVSEATYPRALLADEVGLGKTIEACQILQQLVVTGRAKRVLVLVPEPLKHQWFVELLRRFHMLFALFDEERCQSLEVNDSDENPFLDSQLVLCSTNLFQGNTKRRKQLVDADWDCLVVDEAHHLEWSEEEANEDYLLVEQLCQKTASVLLLTATPQQLGAAGHFARLRLLDPVRFSSLEDFRKESTKHEQIAELVDYLVEGEQLREKDEVLLKSISPRLLQNVENREDLISDVLDVFSTGKLMFRNRRKHLSGFPKRLLHTHCDSATTNVFRSKLKWLIAFLAEDLERKVLLICSTRDMVGRLAEAIRKEITIELAEFHEDLALVQRDRNAAYFAEDEGARILLCSEIGSEGRNFQFCHHLVLFDLPENPDLLEQRIGRLDRIGQTKDINIHVPVVEGQKDDFLLRWYQKGLNAFEQSVMAAGLVYQEVKEDLKTVLASQGENDLETVIEKTVERKVEISKELEKGYDRLLARSSFDEKIATQVRKQIIEHDENSKFDKVVVRLFEYCGLNVERIDDRSYVLKQGDLISDAFPEIPEEGLSATFDRRTALSREHWAFLSIDHPLITSALEQVLFKEIGNSSFAIWNAPGGKHLFLEARVVVEALAAASLGIERFLIPEVRRIVFDHEKKNCSDDLALQKAKLKDLAPEKIMQNAVIAKKVIPVMLDCVNSAAEKLKEEMVKQAEQRLQKYAEHERARVMDLHEKQSSSAEQDLESLDDEIDGVRTAIQSARVKLDALRFIVRVS